VVKKVAVAMMLAVSLMAQEPAKAPDMKLTEVETLKWEKIQLLADKLNNEYKISEYNAKLADLQRQLAALNAAAIASRKLDPKEYEPNWQAGVPQIVKKAAEQAKK
jgi:hypothetical protein